MTNKDAYDAVSEHLKRYFDSVDLMVFHEIVSPDFHLDVYLIKANNERKHHILMTSGVSSIPMNVPDDQINPYVELMMILPGDWDIENDNWRKEENYWPIELIKSLARYPLDHKTWIGLGHTIPESKDTYLAKKGFRAIVLIKSAELNPEFQRIEMGSNTIEVLLVFPLYNSEYEFKKQYGINELLALLDENQIKDEIDLKRKNVIQDSI